MGRTTERRGLYHGDAEWRQETNFSWFPDQHFLGRTWCSVDPKDTPTIQLVSKISERVSHPPDDAYDIVAVATAVYNAETCPRDRSRRTQVIVKIHMRIPCIPIAGGKHYVSINDLHSQSLPMEQQYPDDPVGNYETEVRVLQHLTSNKCSSTPALVAAFTLTTHNPWVKNGFTGLIVMEKLQAVTVSEIWQNNPNSQTQVREQLRIQEAFKVTLLNTRRLGVNSFDSAPRNLMWNQQTNKCYMIDFEQAGIAGSWEDRKDLTWQDVTRFNPSKFSEFSRWNIIMDNQYRELLEHVHGKQSHQADA